MQSHEALGEAGGGKCETHGGGDVKMDWTKVQKC